MAQPDATARSGARAAAQDAAKLAGVATLAAPVAWIAYSALRIDHDAPLPPAIDAPRRTFSAPSAGLLGYYVDEGPQGETLERPLLLLHGIHAAASAYDMRPLFEAYRGRRRMYALELPGFGFSERSDRAYLPELYVAAILEFLDDVVAGTGGADVIALSLSCELAALAAVRRPELIRSLVFLAPTGLSVPATRAQRLAVSGRAERLRRARSHPLWAQALFDLLVSRPSIRYFLRRRFDGPIDPGLEAYCWATSHRPGARYAPLYFLSGALFTPDIRRAAYERLEQPVLVLYDAVPTSAYDALPALLRERPNWQAIRISPTRGLPHFERRSRVVAAIDDFWCRVDGRPLPPRPHQPDSWLPGLGGE